MNNQGLDFKVAHDFSAVEELLNQGWRLVSKHYNEYQNNYFLEKTIEHEPPIHPH